MAKKILAVVMAVMVALSAMAITAFADQQITLIKSSSNSATLVATVTFTIPIYPDFGYTGTDHYIEINLPAFFGNNAWNDENDHKIDWSVALPDGRTYSMKSTDMYGWGNQLPEGVTAPVDKQYIYFGYQAHDYLVINGTEQWTTIPQDITYNGTTAITVVGTLVYNVGYQADIASNNYRYSDIPDMFANPSETWKSRTYSTAAYTQVYKDGQPLVNSTSYGYQWGATVSDQRNDKEGDYVFVDKAYTYGDLIQPGEGGAAPKLNVVWTWDHTIANRTLLYGAESVQLVVELAKPINGFAAYNLWAVSDNLYSNNLGQYWNAGNYSGRQFVNSQTVDGTTDKLVFEVPAETLKNSVYGFENVEFAITENILLSNADIFKTGSYTEVDRAKVGDAAGTWGNFGWKASWAGNKVQYKNADVNYAKGGMSDGDVTAKTIYLNVVETPVEQEDVKPPVEDTDQNSDEEGDDITVDDNQGDTADTPDEKNPHTGIALAVVPMLVAAAAAVVAKKH